jgi:lipoyl-dependent peroxiredoxin subunit D
MSSVEALRDRIPDAGRDLRLNLQSVLVPRTLSPEQMWGVAVACAIATGDRELRDAVVHDARSHVAEAVVDDAMAAAAIMGMNNVFYRFRHLIGKESYSTKPAGLRMQRIAKPATNKADFELFCLAVSAINACEACVRSHEHVVLEGGLTEDHVHEAIRVAATLNGAAVALSLADITPAAS